MSDSFTLITGGSSGIGAATCEMLLSAGHRVICLDRKPGTNTSPNLEYVLVDLSDTRATAATAHELAERYPITTIIHNAGAVRQQSLEKVTEDDYQTLANLHIAAPIALVQAALPAMRERRFGRIVLVSSRAVLGLAQRSVYSATKAAMLGLARTWAVELGADGITANVIAPGPIEATEVFHEIIPKGSPRLPAIVQSIPVKRLGLPADVARAILFFADPQAGFITGQTLFVCGGTSVGSIVY
jgi:3-oxoacyl-[acyl-carrier protein] reductase